MAAPAQSAATSAPTKPCASRASASACVCVSEWFRRARCFWRISRRAEGVGTPTSISRSNRPGRRNARSTASGRLVVATTTTPRMLRSSSAPSNTDRSAATTRADICSSPPLDAPASPRPPRPSPPARAGAMASSSSSSTTHGAAAAAAANTPRSAASDSPTAAVTSSGPRTTISFARADAAAARASRVFPVPGGPHSSTPRGGRTPHRAKSSGRVRGSSTVSRSVWTSASTPPRDAYPPAASAADANRSPARRARAAAATAGSEESSGEGDSASEREASRVKLVCFSASKKRAPRSATSVAAPTGPDAASSTSKNALAPSKGRRTRFPGRRHRPSSARRARDSSTASCLLPPLFASEETHLVCANPLSSQSFAEPGDASPSVAHSRSDANAHDAPGEGAARRDVRFFSFASSFASEPIASRPTSSGQTQTRAPPAGRPRDIHVFRASATAAGDDALAFGCARASTTCRPRRALSSDTSWFSLSSSSRSFGHSAGRFLARSAEVSAADGAFGASSSSSSMDPSDALSPPPPVSPRIASATQSPGPRPALVIMRGDRRTCACAPKPVATGSASSAPARGSEPRGRHARSPRHDGTGVRRGAGTASRVGLRPPRGESRGESPTRGDRDRPRGSSPRGDGEYPSGVPERPPFLRGIARVARRAH